MVMVQACYALTAELIARDPYALEAMPLHLAASLELGKKNELFLRSHKRVTSALSALMSTGKHTGPSQMHAPDSTL